MTATGRLDVRFAGAGGQGIVMAGEVLAAAVVRMGGSAAHSKAYGPASRGGASRSDVVVAGDTVGFPLVRSPNVVVALTDEAYRKYGHDHAADAIVIVDVDVDAQRNGALVVPIVETARRIVGTDVASGVVGLGVLSRSLDVFDVDVLRSTIAERVPAALEDANLEAFAAGRDMVG